MENVEFWQTFTNAVISAVFTIIGLFAKRK